MKKALLGCAIALSSLFSALLTVSSAFACGSPFGAGMNVDPHQDIILTHKAGSETYVFQPTVCGNAKDFGLILPVPSVLSAMPELGDDKAFTAVVDISKANVEKKTECISRGGVGGTAPDAGSLSDGTAVVASGHVGFLDYSQIKADSVSSLTAWLDANGYPYDDAAKTTFDSYVTKGWYFIAFKVNQGAPSGTDNCRAFGPVKLSFATEKPVIPTRMATAGKTVGPSYFSWRLFAITDAASGQIDFELGSDNYSRKLQYSGALSADDASKLGGLASAGDRLTKLGIYFGAGPSATDDVSLVKKTAADYRETTYDVTYVECGGDDAGPVPSDDAGPLPVDPVPNNDSANGGNASGCSTSSRGSSAFAFAGLALALAAVGRWGRR